jgi:ATP/maltotriose-dependent transcriptional regulator MalT
MARGRYAALEAFLDSVVAAGYRGALSLYLFNEALGAPRSPGGDEAERLGRELAGDLYERARPDNRLLFGLRHVQAGQLGRAAAVSAALEHTADSTGDPSARLFADALAAHVAVARGDTAEALRRFGRLAMNMPERLRVWTPAYTLAPTRLLQGEVLLAQGRYAEADSVVGMLEQATILSQQAALPNTLLLRAEIARGAGRPARAAEYEERVRRIRESDE